MKKKNNKGFSLVELIVVVLIMAIIAVALAPQVMKWVENSRKSTDIENYNALKEAANVASTNESYLAVFTSEGNTIQLSSSGTTITTGTGNAELTAILNDTLPGWGDMKVTSGDWSSKTFTNKVFKSTNGIKVGDPTIDVVPVKDFS